MTEDTPARAALGSLFSSAAATARRLPGGAWPAKVIEGYGGAVLFAHDVAADLVDRVRGTGARTPALPTERRPAAQPDSPAQLMERLISRSLEQDTAAGKAEVHLSLLRQLVPDEARILATLAETVSAPLVHIHHRSRGDALLENASLIGRTASVTVPSLTPQYVSHLRALGLVEIGPENDADGYGYELLLADSGVRRAMREGQFGKLPAKVVRRTVLLSPLGLEVWQSTQQDAAPSDSPDEP
ncbi:MAG: Abi-alpha family protein [Aeromicrobium sp.]